MHMKRIADRLFGGNYKWSLLGAGRSRMPLATTAEALGGNVPVYFRFAQMSVE
jgi:uncharacterized protein (DUF849 family)